MLADKPKLSVVIPTHNDPRMLWATVQALRIYHPQRLPAEVQLVVVDDSPDAPAGADVRIYVAQWLAGPHLDAGVKAALKDGALPGEAVGWGMLAANRVCKYVRGPQKGPAKAKEDGLYAADADHVLVMDSHVFLLPGALDALLVFWAVNRMLPDLIQGPLVYDNLIATSSSFSDVWRGESKGTWQDDPQELAKGKPFEIQAQGMGLFSCRKDAWPRFPQGWKGFCPEEWILHGKFRQRGTRCLCLPQLRWNHCFMENKLIHQCPKCGLKWQGNGKSFALRRWDKVRGYVLGYQELGWDLQEVYNHFVSLDYRQADESLREHLVREHSVDPKHLEGKTEAELEGIHKAHKLPRGEWDLILAGAEDPPVQQAQQGGCQGCGQQKDVPAPASLEAAYQAALRPSDISEHVPTLKELAQGCETVVEVAHAPTASTAALLAGQPKTLIVFGQGDSAVARSLKAVAGETVYEFHAVDPLAPGAGKEVPDCDLLFLDTLPHNAARLLTELERYGVKARRIALHDTDRGTYGERGDDGSPGLLVAVREFTKRRPEWFAWKHWTNNHGLTVLSRRPEDRSPDLPSLAKQGVNYLTAKFRHWWSGDDYLAEPEARKRYSICTSNGGRCPANMRRPEDDRCAACGCWLWEVPADAPGSGGKTQPGRTFYPNQGCPLGLWQAVGNESKGAAS